MTIQCNGCCAVRLMLVLLPDPSKSCVRAQMRHLLAEGERSLIRQAAHIGLLAALSAFTLQVARQLMPWSHLVGFVLFRSFDL